MHKQCGPGFHEEPGYEAKLIARVKGLQNYTPVELYGLFDEALLLCAKAPRVLHWTYLINKPAILCAKFMDAVQIVLFWGPM